MPELPEVETVCRQLNERLSGKTILELQVFPNGKVFPSAVEVAALVNTKMVRRVYRRAKLIVIELSSDMSLVTHLKMTGRLVFERADKSADKHDRAHFVFTKGEHRLTWADVRRFGYIRAYAPAELATLFTEYGPEPLEISATELATFIPKRRTSIKALLLDQAVIAGVGNIYADEACHRAGIRPQRRAHLLTAAERLRLATEIQNVLRESIAVNGTSAVDYVDTSGEKGTFQSFLRVYGRAEEPCRNCGAILTGTRVAGRGTVYCPKCQK